MVYVDVKNTFATENQATNINFENLHIGYAQDSTAEYLFANNGEAASTYNAIINLSYKDCTIDLVTNRPSGFKSIAKTSTASTNALLDMNLSFDGCKFIANSITDLTYIENKNEGDSVVFNETNTNKLLMHPSVAAPDFYTTFTGSAGSKLVAIETLDREDSLKVYSIEKGTATKYGAVPTELASNSKYPFLLFTVNSADEIAFHSAAEDYVNALYNSRMYGELISANEMIVLMTNDFGPSGLPQQLGMSPCDITVDLDGHTLNAYALLRNWVGSNACDNITITYKNGNILSRGYALIEGYTWDGFPDNYAMNINFENVNIGFMYGANSGALLFRVGGRDATAGNAIFNINLTDCTLDYVTNHSSSSVGIVSASKTATDTKDDVKLVFDGCDIILPKFSDLNMTNATEGDSVLFKNCLTNDTRILTSTAASLSDYAFESAEGYELTIVEQEAEDGYFVYKLGSKAIEEVVFTPKASVTLDSNLIFNIYIPAHSDLTAATVNGTPVELTNATDGYYLSTTELKAYEAGKELKLVVELTVDETPIKGTFTFSTVEYAQKLLNMDDTEVNSAEKALAKDMLSYIKSAYTYFSKNGVEVENKDTVIASINEILGGYNETSLKEVTVPEKGGDRTILAGATLVLDATPAIRFYLPDGASLSDYTFKIGSSVLEYTVGEEKEEEGYVGLTYVDISLYAYRMVEEITVTKGTASANYHINFYYQGVDTNNAELVDIVIKFYNYCVSAKNYKNSL